MFDLSHFLHEGGDLSESLLGQHTHQTASIALGTPSLESSHKPSRVRLLLLPSVVRRVPFAFSVTSMATKEQIQSTIQWLDELRYEGAHDLDVSRLLSGNIGPTVLWLSKHAVGRR